MKLESIAAVIASTGILIAGATFAYQQAAPHLSEQSCIIHAVKDSSNAAAASVRACRDRFEQPRTAEEELPSFISSKLEARAHFRNALISANFYNGASLYTITQLRIGVTDPATADLEDPVTHYYDVRVDIPPLSVRSEEFTVYQTYDDIRWHISKAWGHD